MTGPDAGPEAPRGAPAPAARYAVAAVATLAVALLRAALHPVLGSDSALLPFPIAVMIAAWYGGFGPGLLATGLGGAAGAALARGAPGGPGVREAAALLLFLAVGLSLSAIAEAMHRALASAQEQRRRLGAEILERKRAEIRLYESEDRTRRQLEELEQIYRNAPVGLCVLDRAFRFLRINERLAAMSGRPAAEHLGRPVREALPELADHLEPLYRRVLEAGRPVLGVTLRARSPAHAGAERVCVANFFPVQDPSGYAHAVGCVVEDVTGLALAEEEARRRERQLALIMEEAPICVAHLDRHGRCLLVNRNFAECFGLDREHVLGRPLVEALGDRAGGPLRDALASALAGRRRELELDERAAGTGPRVLSGAVAPLRDASGEIEGAILVLTDVTARRLATEKIEDLNVELRRRVKELQAIFDSAPIAIWIAHDPECSVVMGNHYADRLLGVPRGSNVSWHAGNPGGPPALAPRRAGRDAAGDPTPLWHAASSGRATSGEEIELTLPDGRVASLLASSVPLFDEAGRVRGAVALAMDITARKAAERERERLLRESLAARAAAEAAGRAKDEFLAMLSHELRTPLNAIVGWVHILRRGNPDEQDLREGLEVIDQNCRMQLKLIEDLLDVSSIMAGKLRLERGRVDLAEVIDGALAAIEPAARAKGLALRKEYDPHARPVPGDRARLEQVVWNLLSNAVKFTPRGGRVEVRLAADGDRVVIRCTDSGVGIDPAFLPHVFERFRQADGSTTRRQGGLGLGLAIVKQLVEMHGGSVRAESEGPGRGASFIIDLPAAGPGRADADGEPPPVAAAPSDEAAADRPLDGLRVLVVDDQKDARELLGHGLALCGAHVRLAASVAEALHAVRHDPPRVVISDIGMPEQDGYDLLRRLRSAEGPDPAPPVVALTAFARPEDRDRALGAGFAEHLAKPVDLSRLAAVVARLAAGSPG